MLTWKLISLLAVVSLSIVTADNVSDFAVKNVGKETVAKGGNSTNSLLRSDPNECTCGPHTVKCHFNEREKMCRCEKGYYAKLGECVGDCREVCGEQATNCLLGKGYKKCYCKDGYADKSGICTQCNCGTHTDTCLFYNGKKSCICNSGYALKFEICTECNCGWNSSSCVYGDEGEKVCDCNYGYGNKLGTCTSCNAECGEQATRCSFFDGVKRCECKDGYADKLGTCTQCNCGEHATVKGCIFGLTDGVKVCLCQDGYHNSSGKCTVSVPWFQNPIAIAVFVIVSCLLVFGVSFAAYKKFRGNRS